MNALQLALGYIEQIRSACPRGWAGSTLPSPPLFAAVSIQLWLCPQLPLSLLELEGQMSSEIDSLAYQQLSGLQRAGR